VPQFAVFLASRLRAAGMPVASLAFTFHDANPHDVLALMAFHAMLTGKCRRNALLSPGDNALHLCKSRLVSNLIIGAICFTGASQSHHSRLYRQPHVNERFLSRCD
jgi:hypothetical protein